VQPETEKSWARKKMLLVRDTCGRERKEIEKLFCFAPLFAIIHLSGTERFGGFGKTGNHFSITGVPKNIEKGYWKPFTMWKKSLWWSKVSNVREFRARPLKYIFRPFFTALCS
jgi:hypothetical protein